MSEALLLVDVLKDFEHEDGDALLASYRRRLPALVSLLGDARARGLPVVYANDGADRWTEADELVRHTVEAGKAGDLVAEVAPRSEEPLVLKGAYSAFDGTELARLLRGLGVERFGLAGTATEMCVFQTALDARRQGFDVLAHGDACATVDVENERIALAYLERVLGLEVVYPPD